MKIASRVAVSSFLRSVALACLMVSAASVRANPADGSVASGAVTIVTSPGTVTVNQLTDKAIINWQSFSIGAGELTKFVQPSSASAILNRVLGGQTSIINGTLSSNGQVYLLNGNGVLIGPGGVVNTAGFTASTRDISDADFTSGNLHFTGTGGAGVTNLGTVSALGGDVIFIGKTVDNQGTLTAANGHVGLAAADDVMISQAGMEHVFVRSTASATAAPGQTAVNNSGSIIAASAELKAANGNIYALATNNSGIIRATGVSSQDGHIWLVAEGNQGVTQNTGTLAARTANGQGGDIETSGGEVIAHGTVDAGDGGTWLIDPSNITIDAPTAATIVTSLNGGSTVTEDSSVGTGGSGDITVSSAITWTGTGTLNLYAYRNLAINSAITGTNGSLAVKSSTGTTGSISATAAVSVKNFALQGGSWVQTPAGVPPGFSATNFTITGGASFLRSQGGSGTAADPYQLVDVYGLQGVGSSAANLSASWRVTSAIDASGTSGWNSGAGFVPISGFTGSFNGNGAAISGLFINTPAATNVGLFGSVGSAGTLSNVVLTGANVTGLTGVGALVGSNAGSITTSSAAGTVSGTNSASSLNLGGLTGVNSGSITSSFSATTVTGYGNAGGLVGNNSGTLTSDYSTGNTASFLNASLSGSNLGGLVGLNNGGSIILSYTTGNTTATDTASVGGLVGGSTGSTALIQQGQSRGSIVTGYSQVGGLVGSNASSSSIVAGTVIDNGTTPLGVKGTLDVGGLVGNNSASIIQSSVVTTHGGSILGQTTTTAASHIGGFVGTNSGAVSSSFALLAVGEAVGTTNAQWVGGFAGFNTAAGNISGAYATGNVTASGAQFVGGFVGENDGTLGVQTNATGNVTGGTDVGGLVGSNTGTLGTQSFATGNVTGLTFVGGLIGINTTTTTVITVYAKGTVTGTSQVGGLIGSNVSGNFTSSTASGAVSGTGTQIGGLMGHNGGTLTLDSASGNVTASSASSVGGLVGDNSGSIFSGTAGSVSSASGNVTGNSAVGGLVGTNTSTGIIGDPTSYVAALADYTQASGTVTGLTLVGGLVGDNAGSVSQGAASGPVNGSASATAAFGGLVGRNETTGTITTSFSTSTVHANGTGATNGAATDVGVGGLVGANLGGITMSNATGSVVGDLDTGGLVGLQNAGGAVTQISYSTGNVTGLVNTGGLVGYNQLGSVTQNYSTSLVVGSTSVGGLVGLDAGSISQDYATGGVTGTTEVGGLVGQIATGGTLTQSYATGAVSGATAGGLVGLNGGTITSAFWDGDSTGQGTTGVGSGSATGATELTSTSGSTAFASASYAGFGTVGTVAGADSNIRSFTSGSITWYMFEGGTRPFLAWEAPINNPTVGGAHVIYTAHQLQLVSVALAGSYVLGKNIDLTATQSTTDLWNPATGFVPIGTASQAFTGSLSGGSFGITSLYINQSGATDVGLFGNSSGALSGISLSGTVTGGNDVGLLVGNNAGSVSGARLSGTVAGQSIVGGLAGASSTTVSSAAVNVAVSGVGDVGGILGTNTGTLQDSYSLGAVTDSSAFGASVGGLVGSNFGTVNINYATGAVTAGSSDHVGGAVGINFSVISQTYATGAVSGSQDVGGVVGLVGAGGSVSQSYATGAVGGSANVGGVAGEIASTGTVARSYASGVVTGTTAATTGGVLGLVDTGAAYSNLFWDHTKSATAIGTDNIGGAGATDLNGLTINGSTATYAGLSTTTGFTTGFDSSALIYGSGDNVWRVQKGSEFPLLTQLSTQVSGTAYTNEGHLTNVGAGVSVTLNSGSNLLHTTTTDANGAFAFLFAADDGLFNYLPLTNQTLRISDSAASADSIAAKLFNGNGVPDLLADLASADTWGTTVRAVSPGLNNLLLTQAGSSFVSNPGGNAYGGTNVDVSENFDIATTAVSYSITGDITATGDFMVDAASSVPTSFDHPVTLDAKAGSNAHPTFTQNVGGTLTSGASNRAIIVESDGNYVNNVGAGAFSTPSGTWIVYSQNPPGSGQSVVDTTNGLNELHLYGTNPTQTPAYLLSPGLNYQIYSFTPTLTLTAIATGATAGTLNVQYGTSTPALTYAASGLLTGDNLVSGSGVINVVISNQPGEQTTYAKYSAQGTYPVTFTSSTLPTSLIGYNLVFAPGSIVVGANTTDVVTIVVSGSQHFAYMGGGATFNVSSITDSDGLGTVANDPNFHPTFTTTVGQFTNVGSYSSTISLNPASITNYTQVFTTTDMGFTVIPANLTVSATGTSIYGDSIVIPSLSSTSPTSAGTIYDNSGTGSTVALSTLGYSVSPTATSASHVGSYSSGVTGPSGTGNAGALGNYNITVSPGTYTITKRPLVIDATQNETYGYDGTPGLTTFGSSDYSVGATSAGTGLVNGDQITGLMGRVTNTNPNVNHYNYTVGTLGTATSGGTATSDYTFTFNNHGFGLNITPRLITIGALENETKQYGSSDPNTNLGGLLYGITSGSLATGESFATTGTLGRTAGENVNGGTPYLFTSIGTVGIVNSSSASTTGNYTISFNNTSNYGLTITTAPLTVTANNDSKTYNGNAYTGGNGVTYAGFQFTDSSASLGGTLNYLSGSSQGAINAGSYAITPAGYTSGNYSISYVSGTLTVGKAPLTVTADNQNKTYGGTDPTLTYTPSGTLYGTDTYGVISGVGLSTATGAAATAGTHAIVATGGTASNYAITDVNGTLTVAKATLTATPDDQSKTYGGTDPTLTYTIGGTLYYTDTTGVVTGVNLSTVTAAAATAGTHAITATGGTASNYTVIDGSGTLTVAKAPLTVTANDQSKTYGGTDPTLTYTVGGTLYYTDTASVVSGVSLATTTGAAATAGTHVITATGGTASNYSLTDANGTLTVAKATLTETADNQSKTYGGADPTLTSTLTGTLYYGDTASVVSGVSLATTTGAAATAGTHPITTTGGTAFNYNIVDVDGTLTVAKANLTVTPSNTSTVYGTTPTPTYVVGGTLYYGDTASVVSGVTLTTTYGSNPGVGTYSATPVGGVAANYNITDLGITTLTVTPAPLYATADNQSKIYGAADPTLTFRLSGTLYYGDTYAVVSGVTVSAPTGAAATAGTHTIVTAGGVAANYQIFDLPGTLTVSKATLTATADNQSKTYGGADPILTYTPGGTLYYGDTYGVISGVNLSTATGSAATAGTHIITAAGGTASNYNVVDSNGTLTVAKANLTVNADNKSKTYGGTDPSLTYTVGGTLFYGDTSSVVSGVSLATTTGLTATAGTHPITATGGTASNYNLTDVNGLLTVSQAPLTITANPESKFTGVTFVFNGSEFTSSGLFGSDTVTQVGLTSAATPATALPGTYPINLTPGSATGSGLSNYAITFVSAPFTVIPGTLSQLPISWNSRAQVGQLIGGLFNAAYGERMFYELEVPGTIHRVVPSDLTGIGTGSSLVDIQIGLETVYALDRFQSFRH